MQTLRGESIIHEVELKAAAKSFASKHIIGDGTIVGLGLDTEEGEMEEAMSMGSCASIASSLLYNSST